MRLRTLVGYASLTAVVLASTSCGDVTTTSRAPVILGVSLSPSTVESLVGTTSGETGIATFVTIMKDATLTAPGPNNRVTITRYRVEYRRADGRNAPGVDVPYPFDGAATTTFAANGTGSLTFDLVREVAKGESPLRQITGANVVSTIAQVTFFGHDQVGNDVSVAGFLTINFSRS